MGGLGECRQLQGRHFRGEMGLYRMMGGRKDTFIPVSIYCSNCEMQSLHLPERQGIACAIDIGLKQVTCILDIYFPLFAPI